MKILKTSFFTLLTLSSTFVFATSTQECARYKSVLKVAVENMRLTKSPSGYFITLDKDCASKDLEHLRYITEFSALTAQRELEEMDVIEGVLSNEFLALEAEYEALKSEIEGGALAGQEKMQKLMMMDMKSAMYHRKIGNEVARIYATAAMVQNLNDFTSILIDATDVGEEYARLGFDSPEMALELEDYLRGLVSSMPDLINGFSDLFKTHQNNIDSLDVKLRSLMK